MPYNPGSVSDNELLPDVVGDVSLGNEYDIVSMVPNTGKLELAESGDVWM